MFEQLACARIADVSRHTLKEVHRNARMRSPQCFMEVMMWLSDEPIAGIVYGWP